MATFPIFIDSNIPMYGGGRQHLLRDPCRAILRLVQEHPRAFWTNAEVLQELVHRYRASGRWGQGRDVFEGFAMLMRGRVESVIARDVEFGAQLVDQLPMLDARDLVHLAVMQRVGADTLVSADRGFDQAPGIERLDPAGVAAWRSRVGR
ncbi:MAG TPA: type II toxin-antitoxin system VapC family toxin [Dehalococcoidia bacterium]|nr:type II toxin-antitoxin system VapC family toxin [Dehalococcoidia bacterium]